jgi:hypothetical protein
MAIDFPAYTREELDTRARALVRFLQFNALGIRDADVRPGSDYDIKSRLVGAIAEMLQELGKSALKVIDPLHSFGDFARQYASVHGIGAVLDETDYQAVRSTGTAIARSSTGSQSITAGTVLQHPDGTQYTVDTTGSTTAAAPKSFTTGHRSTRRHIFHGVLVADTLPGEIYEAPGGELCAVRGGDLATETKYRWTQLENELDSLPAAGSGFSQRLGRVIPITAVTPGRIGNKEPKDLLTFVSPPGTVLADARIIRLSGGRNTLSTSQIQQGIRSLYGTRLGALTLQEIYSLVFETPLVDVREAYVFPGMQGLRGAGLYLVVPIGATLGISSAADRTAIFDYAARFVPPTDVIGTSSTTHVPITLALTIKVDQRSLPDWTPPPSFSLTVTTATVSRLTFGGSIPAGTFEVGDRVIVSVARGAGFDEDVCFMHLRITNIGAAFIDISPSMPFAPDQAEVSPGGPYGDGLVRALYDYFDNQAPYAESYSYPSTVRPSAVDTIRAAVMDVPGVLDCVADDLGSAVLAEGDVYSPGALVLRVVS